MPNFQDNKIIHKYKICKFFILFYSCLINSVNYIGLSYMHTSNCYLHTYYVYTHNPNLLLENFDFTRTRVGIRKKKKKELGPMLRQKSEGGS